MIIWQTRLCLDSIVIKRDPKDHHAHEDPYVAVRDAFKAARPASKSVMSPLAITGIETASFTFAIADQSADPL